MEPKLLGIFSSHGRETGMDDRYYNTRDYITVYRIFLIKQQE